MTRQVRRTCLGPDRGHPCRAADHPGLATAWMPAPWRPTARAKKAASISWPTGRGFRPPDPGGQRVVLSFQKGETFVVVYGRAARQRRPRQDPRTVERLRQGLVGWSGRSAHPPAHHHAGQARILGKPRQAGGLCRHAGQRPPPASARTPAITAACSFSRTSINRECGCCFILAQPDRIRAHKWGAAGPRSGRAAGRTVACGYGAFSAEKRGATDRRAGDGDRHLRHATWM